MKSSVTLRQLMESGVHFGHQKQRWNPKMKDYIYGVRNNIHIIDLTQTIVMFNNALKKVREVAKGGGRVLFVGTKRQAAPIVAEAAKKCAQYYVNSRWLGGMMTNWQTVSGSIKTLENLEKQIKKADGYTKKEILNMTRDREKLERDLGGIREMGGLPDIIFVLDTTRESIAIAEAKKLGIPVVAVVDTNCSPDDVNYIVPGNDDAVRALQLYCDAIANAVLDGLSDAQVSSGVDLGSAENPEIDLPEGFEEEPVEEKKTKQTAA
jgi:small subunit ribosomal protein S2